LERLNKIDTLERRIFFINLYDFLVSDDKRIIRPYFVKSVTKDLYKFGELQAHRKIFGFLGIAFVPTKTGEADAMAALGAARASFDTSKVSF
jgi:hypothetical protein